MHAETEIVFHCAKCGQRLSADSAAEGASTACPTCRETVVVPTVAEAVPDGAYAMDGGLDGDVTRSQLLEATVSQGRLERELASAQVEIESLRQQLHDASELRDTALQELSALQDEHTRALEERVHLHGTVEKAKAHQFTLEATATDLRETISRAEAKRHEFERVASGEKLAFQKEIDELRAQLRALQENLAQSKDAGAFVALKEQLAQLQQEKDRAQDVAAEAGRELLLLKREHSGLGENLAAAVERTRELESRLQTLNESQLQKDNTVLRSILERQKGELEQRFKELKKLRRGQFGVRIAYAIVALAALGLVFYAIQFLPALIKAGALTGVAN